MNTLSKSYYQLLREDYDIDRMNKILDNIKRTYTLSRNIIISKPEIQNNLKLISIRVDFNNALNRNRRRYINAITEYDGDIINIINSKGEIIHVE